MSFPIFVRGFAAFSLCLASAASAQEYLAGEPIAVPGDGAWDYASVDSVARRLYIAHGGEVSVVDLASGKPAPALGPVTKAHAVVPVAGGELAVTSGDDATVRFFDTKSSRQVATLAAGKKPDAAVLDPTTGHLFAVNAVSGTISEIDPEAHRVVRTIAVVPGLEFAAISGRTLFVNNEDRNEIEVVDIDKGTTGAPIKLPGCEEPSGLALDAAHGRLISACANGVAAVSDIGSRRLSQLVAIGHGPDAVILDARRSLAFIPAGKDGVLDVLDVSDAKAVKHKAAIRTELGARTGALDPSTGVIYLPTAKLAPTVPGERPRPVPGSFHVLAVKPS